MKQQNSMHNSFLFRAFRKMYRETCYFITDFCPSGYRRDMAMAQLNVVASVNSKTFGEYKNKYCGKDIVIVASGPSLNNYKPLKNTINICINSAIKRKDIDFSFFFSLDQIPLNNLHEELINTPNIKKFFGIVPINLFEYRKGTNYNIIPESNVLKYNASKYYVYSRRPHKHYIFNTEIDKTWVMDGGSSAFSAMQFALFTNPKRIYLVGCDCSSAGHFDNSVKYNLKPLVRIWKELKIFAQTYYPDTEIISVNPVGLKGLFTDLYQNEEQ